jgi:hypothetical protein
MSERALQAIRHMPGPGVYVMLMVGAEGCGRMSITVMRLDFSGEALVVIWSCFD